MTSPFMNGWAPRGLIYGAGFRSDSGPAQNLPIDSNVDVACGAQSFAYRCVFGNAGTAGTIPKHPALGALFTPIQVPATSRVYSPYPVRIGPRYALICVSDR